MGAGLQKGSPVRLNLGRDNYEALLERHGQWVRWRKSVKCPCAEKETMGPDPRCPRCSGAGYFYTCQKELIVTQVISSNDDFGILEVSGEYGDAELDAVYDHNGVKHPAEKHGAFISLEKPPPKGTYLTAVMRQKTARRLETAGCINAGGGYYRIEGLQSHRAGIEGLYHTAPGDIVKIEKIIDAEGNKLEAEDFRLDLFTVKTQKEIAGPLTAHGVEYIPPFIFALLNQNLKKPDEKMIAEAEGDAVCTFPYNCDAGEDDVITVLAGSYTHKEVINRVKNSDYDVLGAYFVMGVSSCVGIEREYISGADFILAGTNSIKWLCGDAPAYGEAYSISYQVCPTYKVVKAIPQIRTSENQRLPKKVIVRLLSGYREKQGVNRQ